MILASHVPRDDTTTTPRRSRTRAKRSVSSVYLAVLLLVMAAGQVSDVGGFREVLVDYALGRTAAAALAAALIGGEVLAGVGILVRRTRRIGGLVALVVAVAWSALAVQAFARGLVLDNCGCFGVHLAQPLRWWVLLEDAWFIALAGWVWAGARPVTR